MRTTSEPANALGPSEKAAPARSGRRSYALLLERLCAVVCLGASVFVGVFAESLVSQSSIARPGAFPAHGALWLGAAVLGLASFVWAAQAMRRREAVEVPDLGRASDVMRVFALLLAGAWSVRWLGLLPAAAVTYVALMWFYRDRSWLFVLGSTVGYVLLLHFGLEVLLGVRLARSPIFSLPF